MKFLFNCCDLNMNLFLQSSVVYESLFYLKQKLAVLYNS